MKTKSLLFIIVALVLAAGALSISYRTFWQPRGAQPNSSDAPIAVTLGFRPGVVVDLALLQAIERGEFRKHGFDVSLKPYGRADLIFAALNSGEIQGSLGVPLEPLLDQASKGVYPVRGYLVWYFDSTTPYDGLIVRADGAINTLSDLKGKTVGSHPSKQVSFFVSRFLPESTVKPYNPAAPLTSIETGDMAAAYVLEPFVTIARSTQKYRVLETNLISKQVFNGTRVPAALSVLSSSWMDAHPIEATNFVRLAREAYLIDAKNRDKTLITTILSDPKFGLSKEIASQVTEPASSLPEDMDISQFQKFVSVLKEGGLLSGEVTPAKLLFIPPAK